MIEGEYSLVPVHCIAWQGPELELGCDFSKGRKNDYETETENGWVDVWMSFWHSRKCLAIKHTWHASILINICISIITYDAGISSGVHWSCFKLAIQQCSPDNAKLSMVYTRSHLDTWACVSIPLSPHLQTSGRTSLWPPSKSPTLQRRSWMCLLC